MNAFGDPTYDKAAIEMDPVWLEAWRLSEQFNDNAPIGWARYIPEAKERIEAGRRGWPRRRQFKKAPAREPVDYRVDVDQVKL